MPNFGIKNTIDKLFSNTQLITILKVQRITKSNNNFDYGAVSEQLTEEFNVKAVPANYVKSDLVPLNFGDLEQGDMRFFCKSDTEIDDNDKVIFNNEEYLVKRINAYWVGGVIVAKVLVIHNVLNR